MTRLIVEFVKRTRHEANPFARGWQLVVPLRLDRKQAVYVGPAGTDAEGRAIMGLVSVCGPVNDRDCRTLLKLNARIVDGHFAVRVLRGEEYFVVIENLAVDAIDRSMPRGWCGAWPSWPTASRIGSHAAGTFTDAAARSVPQSRRSDRSRSWCRR